MAEEHAQYLYDSPVPFESRRIGAAAVYCSDGRFGAQFDDFVRNALGLPRYDRLAVPGGAACLAGHFATYREEDAAIAQLEFLIEVHGLTRVVLVAHQDCAFYTKRLDASPLGLADQQLEDLGKAVERVRGLGHELIVDAWFAHQQEELVTFELVPT